MASVKEQFFIVKLVEDSTQKIWSCPSMYNPVYDESIRAIWDSTESIKFILVSTKLSLMPDIWADEYKKKAS